MLQYLRRRWLLLTVVSLVVIAGIVAVLFYHRNLAPLPHEESDLPPKPEAPPDLEKLRDRFASGIDALGRHDGADAVEHLSSFDFGSRAVEEYRLYYLAEAQQMTGNSGAARVTLAKLWRRKPRMIHAPEAASRLASHYSSAGDLDHTAEVYATLARREGASAAVTAPARISSAKARLEAGDVAGALYEARTLLIHHPATKEAEEAAAIARALLGLDPKAGIPLTHSEQLERAIARLGSQDPQNALEELTVLEKVAAPHLRRDVQLQKGVALSQLKRYVDSNQTLEPLTGGEFKQAIPALRVLSRNYGILAASIDPNIYKTVKEKKRVGSVKVRVGKGKKRRTVTKPKYKTVFRQVKLVDLAKKKKKDEYERLASERLKDILQIPKVSEELRLETLNALIARAEAKNQDDYVRELVPQVIRIDPNADPGLQHIWDKGWAAYARGDLQTARKLFHFIADTYTHVNVRRQAEYWYARTVERLGNKEEAALIYRKLAQAPYADLYALHSAKRGAPLKTSDSNPLKRDGPDWRELAEKEMPEELQLAYELTALSAMREAYQEIRRNRTRTNVRFAEALMADVYNAAGNKIAMYRSLRQAWPQLATVEQDSAPVYFLEMYYPRRYGDEIEKHAKKQNLDPNLVRGLILQESYYNPKARSRVGATGLMQLMPPTAKDHSRSLGIVFGPARLENPDVNIQLGTFHLRMLVNMFRGNEYLAIASYNAGQGNVLKWRRAAPGKPVDEFLESIPFQETRNYVKRVTMLRSAYARFNG